MQTYICWSDKIDFLLGPIITTSSPVAPYIISYQQTLDHILYEIDKMSFMGYQDSSADWWPYKLVLLIEILHDINIESQLESELDIGYVRIRLVCRPNVISLTQCGQIDNQAWFCSRLRMNTYKATDYCLC